MAGRGRAGARAPGRSGALRGERPQPAQPGLAPLGLALLALGALLGVAMRFAPEAAIERDVAGALHPLVTALVVPVASAAPLPLTPLLALLALALIAAAAMPSGRRWRRAGLATLALALIAAAWFQLGWGLLYGRAPVERLMALPQQVDVGAQARTLDLLAATLAATADAEADVEAAVAALAEGVATLAERLAGARPTLPDRVRRLPPGTLLRFGSAGAISPFTLEAHVDGGLPPAAFVAVAGHELAHVAGFAREADAELIGAIAGLTSEDRFARYAAALAQGARIIRGVGEAERAAWLASLPERARTDLEALAAASDRYRQDRLAAPLLTLYDRYLRAQGVAAGSGDYDRSAELLVRAHAGGWLDYLPSNQR